MIGIRYWVSYNCFYFKFLIKPNSLFSFCPVHMAVMKIHIQVRTRSYRKYLKLILIKYKIFITKKFQCCNSYLYKFQLQKVPYYSSFGLGNLLYFNFIEGRFYTNDMDWDGDFCLCPTMARYGYFYIDRRLIWTGDCRAVLNLGHSLHSFFTLYSFSLFGRYLTLSFFHFLHFIYHLFLGDFFNSITFLLGYVYSKICPSFLSMNVREATLTEVENAILDKFNIIQDREQYVKPLRPSASNRVASNSQMQKWPRISSIN